MIRNVLLFGVAVLIVACTSAPVRLQPPISLPEGVQFTLSQPEAESVAIAGNFNGWSSTAYPMSRSSDNGVWSIIIPLPPGEHLFMYVVNGEEWVQPPFADDFIDDGFGQTNGMVIVR